MGSGALMESQRSRTGKCEEDDIAGPQPGLRSSAQRRLITSTHLRRSRGETAPRAGLRRRPGGSWRNEPEETLRGYTRSEPWKMDPDLEDIAPVNA